MIAELRLLAGDAAVLGPAPAHYLGDATEGRGLHGHADAVVWPADADEVAAVVRWCYEHDVAIVPRGGGTGYAAGAVPLDGGVVLALDRLDRVRSFEPLLWRMEVEAGVPTAEVRRRARESGLLFPPDRARRSSRRSAATWPRTRAGRTRSSAASRARGDRSGGGRRARRARPRRRLGAPARGRLRPAQPASRLRGGRSV